MEKGTWGYMDTIRKARGRYALILSTITAALIVAVYLITGTVQHIAIVIPLLMLIPTANMLVQWVIVARFHSLKEADMQEIETRLAGRFNCILLYDMALSSEESISFAPCIAIDQGNIYLLWGGSNEKKYDENRQREYIQGLVVRTAYDYTVVTVHSAQELADTVGAAEVAPEDRTHPCEHLRKRLMDISV